MNNSTRIALQAAIALSIALVLANWFHLSRPYWGIIATVLLVSQTLGESLKKSLARIGMTILGGVFGTLLYFGLSPYMHIMFVIMCAALFFIGFYIEISYGLSVAFTTIVVVFLFASLTNWTLHTLWIRIYETMFGAAIAVFCSSFIFPIKATKQLQKSIPNFLVTVDKFLHKGYDVLLKDAVLARRYKGQLFKAIIQLKQQMQDVRYESLFPSHTNLDMQQIMILLEAIYSHCASFLTIVEQPFSKAATHTIHHECALLLDTVSKNFSWIISLSQGKVSGNFISLGEIRAELWKEALESIKTSKTTNQDWLNIFSALYMVRRVNDELPLLAEKLKER